MIKKSCVYSCLALFLCFFSAPESALAQGIIDGSFNEKGNVSISLGYTRAVGEAFYVADVKMDPIPAHEKITQDIFSLYGTYGLTDNLTVIASLPYISTQGEGVADPVNGLTEDSGIQDVQLALKYRLGSVYNDVSQLDFYTSLGIGIPGGYEPSGILSLGSGAFATDLHAGVRYRGNSGFFLDLTGGYSLRGKADNNFDGEDFDVPNAILGVARIGYGGSKFYAEAFFDFQHSTSGVDIMGEGFMGNFPETQVNYARLGTSVYVPISSAFGVSVGFGTFIDGRNVTDNNYFSGGVTVGF